jgi:hypothetical protein
MTIMERQDLLRLEALDVPGDVLVDGGGFPHARVPDEHGKPAGLQHVPDFLRGVLHAIGPGQLVAQGGEGEVAFDPGGDRVFLGGRGFLLFPAFWLALFHNGEHNRRNSSRCHQAGDGRVT